MNFFSRHRTFLLALFLVCAVVGSHTFLSQNTSLSYLTAQVNTDMVTGCTDHDALNFDWTATHDDGGCLYEGDTGYGWDDEYGCTDILAINYIPGALVDDGSCMYSCEDKGISVSGDDSLTVIEASYSDDKKVTVVLGDPDMDIRSVTVTSKPQSSNPINMGDTSINWHTEIADDSKSVEIKPTNAKWYGVEGYDDRCYTNSEDSLYDVTVNLAIGDDYCVTQHDFELKVENEFNKPGTRGAMTPIVTASLQESLQDTIQFFGGRGNGSRVCYSLDNVEISVECEITATYAGQYGQLVRAEEEYHCKQIKDLDWSDGGTGHIPLMIKRELMGTTICEDLATDKTSNEVYRQLKRESIRDRIKKLVVSAYNAADNAAYTGNSACWVEHTAKQAVGATKDKGGFDLKCSYGRALGCGDEATKTKNPVHEAYKYLEQNW